MVPHDYETVQIITVTQTMQQGRIVDAETTVTPVRCYAAPSPSDASDRVGRRIGADAYDLYARGILPVSVNLGDLVIIRGARYAVNRVPAVWRRGDRTVGWTLHVVRKEDA